MVWFVGFAGTPGIGIVDPVDTLVIGWFIVRLTAGIEDVELLIRPGWGTGKELIF